jgi:3-isopropylmalate/(R)-2-methylmalate dehydratase small subunit
MPCVVASKEDIEALSAAVKNDPTLEITIDVEGNRVRYGDGKDFPVHIVESAREALISAKWDPIGELLKVNQAIEETADALPYMSFQP